MSGISSKDNEIRVFMKKPFVSAVLILFLLLSGCGQTRWVTTDSKGLMEMQKNGGIFNQRRYLGVNAATIDDTYGAYLVVQVTDTELCFLFFSSFDKMDKAYKTISEKYECSYPGNRSTFPEDDETYQQINS